MGVPVGVAAVLFIIAAIVASGKLWCMALSTSRDNKERDARRGDVLKATNDLLSRMK